MSTNTIVFSTVLTGIIALSVPAYMAGRVHTSVSSQAGDASITMSVRTQMIASSALRAGDIDVNTEDGSVYLVGRVGSAEARAEAERIAWSCDGVRQVVNELEVGGSR